VRPTSDLLLADARATLQRTLAHRPQMDLAIVFGHWMLMRPTDAPEAAKIVSEAVQKSGAQQDFQAIATLGFATASGLFDVNRSATLKQGLNRLAGRQAFVDEVPMAFCSDAVGILGVALGAKFLADASVSAKIVTWLSSFLKKIYHMDGTEDWQRCLFQGADRVLGGSVGLATPPIDQTADVYSALTAKGVFVPANGKTTERRDEKALRLILLQGTHEIPYERAAIRLAALEYAVRSAPTLVPGRVSAEHLIRLLERVPAGLRKWTWETQPRTTSGTARQWHIDHEYHVQNLLWALLAPIFPDLDDEQYLAKIGQKNPRADLYIPSMKLIVEAKFLRAGDRMQKIIDEISSDASLYTAMGNDCAGVIPFIWDDSARSHEHDYLRQGLKKLAGIIDAVVVSRPSDWDGERQSLQPMTKRKKTSAQRKQ
jgi:REase_DpnII-MboI